MSEERLQEVLMPQMGESISEGTVTKWLAEVGMEITRDEALLEISTDKVDAEIPSPVGGRLTEVVVPEGKTVPIHTVLAWISTSEKPHEEAPKRKAWWQFWN